MDARLLSKSGTSIRTPSDTDASVMVMLSGDARPARMAVMGVVLEGRAAARAVSGGSREAATAFGTEQRVRFRARAVGGTWGSRSNGDGTAPGSRLPALRPQGDQRFGGVPGFQRIVVRVRQLPGRAVELDFFQRTQRDRS